VCLFRFSIFVMVALCNRADHNIFMLFLLSFFFSSPNLSGRRLDVYHTLAHGVASSTCPDNMVNFGPLMADIGSGVWGTPTNFNGFCVLAALLHGI